MEFNGILNIIIERAKGKKQRIVLPESQDVRILEAAKVCSEKDIADIILIGDRDTIISDCNKNNIALDFSKVTIENPLASNNKEKYINAFYELRKAKGISIEDATNILKDNVYFGTMMVKLNDADGLVSGAVHSTADTLRPALQIIKGKPGIKTISSFILVETENKDLGEDGVLVFSDCGLIEFPTEDELVEIVKASRKSFRSLVQKEEKIALLSYSTKGSAKSEAINKLGRVLERVKQENDAIVIDGELQLDAAIIPEVAKLKAPDSKVAGHANILIFPELEAGNIGYKLVQRFGNALTLGPITQGLAKPINDLSRGCSAKDVVGAIAITCVQAQEENN